MTATAMCHYSQTELLQQFLDILAQPADALTAEDLAGIAEISDEFRRRENRGTQQ